MRMGFREVVLLAVLLALPLLAWWLVFRPQNAEIGQAGLKIKQKTEMLDELQATTSKNGDLARQNEENHKKIEAIEARLPSSKEVDQVVRQVSELAVQSGLEPPGIESDKPVAAATYMEQPLKMKISGDFNGFHGFLKKLEDLPRVTRIPDMKITRATEVNGHMRAEFTLSIYFQPESDAK